MHFVCMHGYMRVWVEDYLRWLLQHSAALSPALKEDPGLGGESHMHFFYCSLSPSSQVPYTKFYFLECETLNTFSLQELSYHQTLE